MQLTHVVEHVAIAMALVNASQELALLGTTMRVEVVTSAIAQVAAQPFFLTELRALNAISMDNAHLGIAARLFNCFFQHLPALRCLSN